MRPKPRLFSKRGWKREDRLSSPIGGGNIVSRRQISFKKGIVSGKFELEYSACVYVLSVCAVNRMGFVGDIRVRRERERGPQLTVATCAV